MNIFMLELLLACLRSEETASCCNNPIVVLTGEDS